jgi:DNA (cytosine-5)-methyltransferase 1
MWQDFLISKGYSNYVDILNAKDFGVAQNRERCFMVSVLGEYNYKFPKPINLTKTMADYLEDTVNEKYYINSEKAKQLVQQLVGNNRLHGCIGNLNPSGNGINGNVFTSDGLAPTTNKGEGIKICTNLTINNPQVKIISNCITARENRGISNQRSEGSAVIEVNQIGNIVDTGNWENPQRGRIYSANGCSPALNCCGGGGLEPKILEIGKINKKRHSSTANSILNTKGICPTIDTMSGGNRQPKILEPMIVASRGRNPLNSSDRTPGNHVEQRLEPNSEGICNNLTSVQKDNLVLEPLRYRIRKLTPRECWRLMDFTDDDFEKAKRVNSDSQLYKQAGNSIVKAVLMAIFKQMM